jgi:hypothetical protein
MAQAWRWSFTPTGARTHGREAQKLALNNQAKTEVIEWAIVMLLSGCSGGWQVNTSECFIKWPRRRDQTAPDGNQRFPDST